MSILSKPLVFAAACLVGSLCVEVSPAVESGQYLTSVTEELGRTWPHNRRVTVVCHGHSVPTGYFRGGQVRPFDSYPHLLRVALQDRFPTAVIEVTCTGIGGEHAEQGAIRFERDVLSKRPDVISIDYSLNDRSIGLERARKAWIGMIERAKAADIPVILLTPTADTRADFEDPQEPLVQHANQVRGLAHEYNVGLVDSYAAFQRHVDEGGDLGSVMSQGNHPNRAGHELVVPHFLEWFTGPLAN